MTHENTYRDGTIEIGPQESEILSIIRHRGTSTTGVGSSINNKV
jgi:hypothetical protein